MNYFLVGSVFDATMTLQEFFLIILWMVLIAMIVMIIGILFSAIQTMRDIRKIVKENRDNINQILNEVPGITKNVHEVATEASHAVSVFRPTVDNVAETAESVTETIKDNNPVNEVIISAYKTVNNVHKIVDGMSKKADKKAKEKE